VTDGYDVIFVGSGINSLAGAALLARGGKRVLVLEREDRLGGAIWTAEITEPGFVHEVLASWHPLFVGSAAYAELADDLGRLGLEYLRSLDDTAKPIIDVALDSIGLLGPAVRGQRSVPPTERHPLEEQPVHPRIIWGRATR